MKKKILTSVLAAVLAVSAPAAVLANDASTTTTVTTTKTDPTTGATQTVQETTETANIVQTQRTVSALGLNVRSGPGVNYSVLGTLRRGETVDVLSEQNNWYTISYNGGVGFVYAPYIDEQTTVIPQTITTTTTTVTYQTKTVTAKTLNARSGPGTGYAVIGHLYQGEDVVVTSSANGWTKIVLNGGEAYVSSMYLK